MISEQIRRVINGGKKRFCRFFKLHPTSFPYISGDTFRSISDHIYDQDSVIDISVVKDRDIIFVQSSLVTEFFTTIHPKINNRYILITHNGDLNINADIAKYIDGKIIHWFAQNCLILHPKLTPIPIGLENKWYWLHGIPNYFEKLRNNVPDKKTSILYKFNIATNPEARGKADIELKKNSLTETYTDWRESYAYLKTLQNYKFIASPIGNGADCIRTWESMYLGTIPIVTDSVMNQHFLSLGLPMVIISDWSEIEKIDKSFLEDIYATISTKPVAPALWADYWIKEINLKKHA